MRAGRRRDGSELFVTCQLFADNKPLTIPSRTTFTGNADAAVFVPCMASPSASATARSLTLIRTRCATHSWNEWLSMPIKIRDLSPTAQLVFTLWDLYSPGRYTPIGGTTFRLFTQPKYARTHGIPMPAPFFLC